MQRKGSRRIDISFEIAVTGIFMHVSILSFGLLVDVVVEKHYAVLFPCTGFS